ncbi:MAG: glycosyltransferase family 1 protein [Bacteroidaceae bacterium]|nr:glycosyltransferase family 1 protein [Bacteroidaceae bacterium]
MKILLIGEYSNVHATLAEGLRALGHTVTVLSNGDFWKNYPRDIDLVRTPGHWGGIRYLLKAYAWLPRLRGYDVVQLINPMFLELKAERIASFYRQLRRQNGRMFLGSFGIDKPWVEEGLKPETFLYSDFYANGERRHNAFTEEMEADWIRGAKGTLFDRIADDCDGIVASLYENYVCCQPRYSGKLHFIPYPINIGKTTPRQPHPEYGGLRIFIGVPRERSVYKGTDVMLRALQRLERQYTDRMEVVKVESVPFPIYQNLMNHSDVLVDQLYSYTPAMNGLLAMSKGLILVGGGEEVHYHLLQEPELRPIINVRPTEDDVCEQIEKRLLLAAPGERERLSTESVEYIRRHHDHVKVARQYIDLWER